MKRLIPLVIGFFCGIAFLSTKWFMPQVAACDCVPSGSPIQEADASESVFVGKVETIEQGKENYVVVLKVSKRWKGDLSPEITVYTPLHEASCGFKFEKGKEYLVYSKKENGLPMVTICSRTKLLSQAQEDLDELNKRVFMMTGPVQEPSNGSDSGEATKQPTETKETQSSNENQGQTWMWMGGGILAVLAGLVIAMKRKK